MVALVVVVLDAAPDLRQTNLMALVLIDIDERSPQPGAPSATAARTCSTVFISASLLERAVSSIDLGAPN